MRLLPFRPLSQGTVKAVLLARETQLIRAALEILRPAIEADLSSDTSRDSGVARLLPVASRDDPEVEAAYREMAHDQLVRAKLDAIDRVQRMLEDATFMRTSGKWIRELDQDETTIWLTVLNDARLLLGTRLEITEEDYDELSEEQIVDPAHQLYWILSDLLGHLVQAASISAGRGPVSITRKDLEAYEQL